jgi:L-alanine-DL-glutamate epimerase-like enolase superfamily enzyme
LIQLQSLGSLIEWSNRFSQEIKQNPAAFCAIELALLQALAQEKHQTIERLLSLPELSGTFRYSGILGTDDSSTFARLLNQYLQMGFTDFKVKLFGNAAIDHSNLRIIDATTQDQIIRIRFDANNLWQEATIACSYLANLGTQMFAVEEPLTARDFDGMRKLSQTLEVPVILDESFTRLDDFEQIYRDPERWIINVRVSKMGGLKRALAIAQQAEKIGVPIIIGAHVGETSILTRAALTVANVYKDNLVAQEGAFGTFLLEHDIVHPALMFTAGGTIKAEQV